MFGEMDESTARSISYVIGIVLCWVGIGLMLYAMAAQPTSWTLMFAGAALVPLSVMTSRSTRLVLEHEVRRRRRQR